MNHSHTRSTLKRKHDTSGFDASRKKAATGSIDAANEISNTASTIDNAEELPCSQTNLHLLANTTLGETVSIVSEPLATTYSFDPFTETRPRLSREPSSRQFSPSSSRSVSPTLNHSIAGTHPPDISDIPSSDDDDSPKTIYGANSDRDDYDHSDSDQDTEDDDDDDSDQDDDDNANSDKENIPPVPSPIKNPILPLSFHDTINVSRQMSKLPPSFTRSTFPLLNGDINPPKDDPEKKRVRFPPGASSTSYPRTRHQTASLTSTPNSLIIDRINGLNRLITQVERTIIECLRLPVDENKGLPEKIFYSQETERLQQTLISFYKTLPRTEQTGLK